ncbi:hypothetical protein FQA39_LY16388 [Lamprigera yunnana]|nr:hypothetical protein FQA39_LY16388 [Lamprigera yunnana]
MEFETSFTLKVIDKKTGYGRISTISYTDRYPMTFRNLENRIKGCLEIFEKPINIIWKDNDGNYILITDTPGLRAVITELKGSPMVLYVELLIDKRSTFGCHIEKLFNVDQLQVFKESVEKFQKLQELWEKDLNMDSVFVVGLLKQFNGDYQKVLNSLGH